MLEEVIIQFGKDILNDKPPTYVRLSREQFRYMLENVRNFNGLMEFLNMLDIYEKGDLRPLQGSPNNE